MLKVFLVCFVHFFLLLVAKSAQDWEKLKYYLLNVPEFQFQISLFPNLKDSTLNVTIVRIQPLKQNTSISLNTNCTTVTKTTTKTTTKSTPKFIMNTTVLSKDGKLLKTLTGHTGSVNAIKVLENGDLASGSGDKTVKIWNIKNGSVIRTLLNHTGGVMSLAAFPNGLLASGSQDTNIVIWNTTSFTYERTLRWHTSSVLTLAALKNGFLASGSADKLINIWDVVNGKLTAILGAHSLAVQTLLVLPDGNLVSGSMDKTLKIWNPYLINPSLVLNFNRFTFGGVMSLAVLNNKSLAIGTTDNSIIIANPNDGAHILSIGGHTNWVSSLIELKNGKFASGSYDTTIKIWNTHVIYNNTDVALIRTLNGHTNVINALDVLPNGNLVSASVDTTIKIWDE